MNRWLWGLALLAVAACSLARAASGGPAQKEVTLNDYGPAPELTNTVWLNADRPLRLAHLRGKVVLIDFWTFG